MTNRFIGDGDPTFGKQLFDLSETEAEPMVQPDGATDDLRWKTKTAVAGRFGIHHVSLPKPAQLDNTTPNNHLDRKNNSEAKEETSASSL